MTKSLIVFIKNPELGKAKTRIAASVGDTKALEIYKQLLDITRSITSPIDAQKKLYYSSFVDTNDEWSNEIFDKQIQSKEGLGHRMGNAFIETLLDSDKTLLIGSDCPYITMDIIEEGFKALDQHDLVLGPVEDGGFYLIGLKKMDFNLFNDVQWSTDTVTLKTLKNANDLGWKSALLQELSDIDFIEDCERYQRYLCST